jgi:hypothetical protein
LKLIVFLVFAPTLLSAQRPSFTLEHKRVAIYAQAEITLRLPPVKSAYPCANVRLTGTFISPSNDTMQAEGFCDSPDGSTYRIRFMPTKPGTYRFTIKSYAVHRRQIKNVLTTGMAQTGSYSGTLTATASSRHPFGRSDTIHDEAITPR